MAETVALRACGCANCGLTGPWCIFLFTCEEVHEQCPAIAPMVFPDSGKVASASGCRCLFFRLAVPVPPSVSSPWLPEFDGFSVQVASVPLCWPLVP